MTSTTRSPRRSCCWVALSRSDPNWANAAELAELCQVRLQALHDGLHRLRLRVAADARDRETAVHRRPDALVEEVGLQIDLPIGDRNDVRRDVGRHVIRLGLDDRERGERAAAVLLVQPSRALEQAGMEVEDVTGVRLAARRAPGEERDLAIGPGVLRQVVVHDQGVPALVAEELAHRAAAERREVLEGRGR